ncbi:hypothetical protein [cf. Phormidesmis sp. LEGE 11477]|uniref:hypothetical protein n=1 Tax=cf. Phormidesmis sp. LEGE 11477 TaxID=1828680 RepID=UPI00187F1B47|nr:hypothetical protein [cf. Phormidesmis sp. LEGE 11477]MBE9060709.1 hypothetical protein [cf. Phormidesmis sp. LEGE 11477]
MKKPSIKPSKATLWDTAQLVHLSKSLEQSYGTEEINRSSKKGNDKMNDVGWHYQQLLDLSAAMADPFI